MSEHTKEPWSTDYMGSGEADIVGSGGASIICGSTGYVSDADARRIVACVNACAEIDTEMLEIVVENDKTLSGVIADTERQRDELLVALKKIVVIPYSEGGWDEIDEALDIARAAITKAEKAK